MVVVATPIFGVEARQYSALLPMKKTSRQHAVTPSSDACAGVRLVVDMARRVKSRFRDGPERGFCDCNRTRTTSRGVIRRDVSRLPDMAESIFCPVVTSNVSGPVGGTAPPEASSLAMMVTACAPAAAMVAPKC